MMSGEVCSHTAVVYFVVSRLHSALLVMVTRKGNSSAACRLQLTFRVLYALCYTAV